MALNSQLKTVQILTNDVQVLIEYFGVLIFQELESSTANIRNLLPHDIKIYILNCIWFGYTLPR